MNRKSNFLRNLEPTLKELMLGVFVWGVILGTVGVFFADAKISFVLGLAAGLAAAEGMALHMYHFIDRSLEMLQEDAGKHMAKGTIIRFACALALIALVWRLHGNVIAVFLGLLTLKLGAYTQPLMHKILTKIKEGR
ncbi:MAG: hypothetical protein Q4C50_04040 [Eubacteriales bacterium]|nr:hypothetical protein [Eubacteriales bacterium]